MRIARKLALLCLVALAAMAFAAATPYANEALTVTNEEAGAACNTCIMHVVGESRLDAFHVVAVSNCRDEFRVAINGAGIGSTIHNSTGTDSASPGCTREQCETGGIKNPWIFTSEEIAQDVAEMNVGFCLSPVGDMASRDGCTNLPVDVTEEGVTDDHRYMFDVNRECTIGGIPVEIEGHWDAEATHNPAEENEIEIVHQP
jgi:hypothetical protein